MAVKLNREKELQKPFTMSDMKEGQIGEIIEPNRYEGRLVQYIGYVLGSYLWITIGGAKDEIWMSHDKVLSLGIRLLDEGELIEVYYNR